jgi:replicative DNA helicase
MIAGAFDRVPPFNAEAELAVLGGMFAEPQVAVEAAAEILTAEDFHMERHRRCFRAIVAVHGRGEAVDAITVPAELQRAGDMEAVGGIPFLAELLDSTPHAANIAYHAAIVREMATRRRVIEASTQVIQEAYTGQGDATRLVDLAQGAFAKLGERTAAAGFIQLKDSLWPMFERIERLQSGEVPTGLPFGFADLDEATGGAQPGDFIILAGRPSMGKSALWRQVAQNVAIRSGKPVGLFSLEMRRESLVRLALASESRVDATSLRRGRLTDDEYARLATGAGSLNTAPVFIDDTPSLTVMQLRAKARRLKRDHPDLALLGIDYLQLMNGGRAKGENRQEEVSEISRGLKSIARELDLPVIALSQLSRAVEARPDRRPMMSDLRESGSLEQDADVVLFIYRPEYYFGPTDKQGNNQEGVAELIIGKQREGRTGTIPLYWRQEFTMFEDAAKQWRERPVIVPRKSNAKPTADLFGGRD